MANLIVKTVDNEQKFALEQTLNQDIVNDSHVIIDFDTENTFIDKDIHVDLTVPAAAEPTLDIFDITTSMDMGQPENGIYSPEATISGNANVASPGWIASGNRAVAEAGVKIGKINQSLISNGSTQLSSGATINPSDSEQIITISEGYNTARTLVIGAADSSAAGEITSGTATISTVTYTYDSTNDNFSVDGSATVSAPTVNNAGYISLTKGTRNSNINGAIVATTVPKIEIATNLSATKLSLSPTIEKSSTFSNVNSGVLTTTMPSSGFYIGIAIASPALGDEAVVTGIASVTSNGYGTTNSGEYTVTNDSLSITFNSGTMNYIPITNASFANSATSGITYSDISSTAPILISNDYLYINEGYTGNVKISLAKLIPDNATITTSTGANYILSGQSAYDGEGNLIVGSIATYNGSYTIT